MIHLVDFFPLTVLHFFFIFNGLVLQILVQGRALTLVGIFSKSGLQMGGCFCQHPFAEDKVPLIYSFIQNAGSPVKGKALSIYQCLIDVKLL